MGELKYSVESVVDRPEIHWVFSFIAESIGLKLKKEPANSDDLVHIHYGSSVHESAINIRPNPQDILLNELINKPSTNDVLEFDFIHAIKAMLLDEVHDLNDKMAYDNHNRLNSLDSFYTKNGCQETPVINVYVNYLKRILKSKFGLEGVDFCPKGIHSVVILSHDVDDPLKYSILRSFNPFLFHIGVKNLVLYYLEFIKKFVERIIKRDGDKYWAFNEVMDSERKHGFTSTFFFAAKNRFDEGAQFKFDVPYNIKQKWFKAIFKRMNADGFEIGLHASYLARKSVHHLRTEKAFLESISNKQLVGNRHHFWQLGPNAEETLLKHQKIGLKYDSSMAFNDAWGYRRGVALPFYPFSKAINAPIDNLQIPTFLMDSNVMKHPNLDTDEALEKVLTYIDQMVALGGVGSIDWHVRTSFPKNKRFERWGDAYQKILEHLSKKEDVWVTSFENYYEWYMLRRSKIDE